MKHSFYKVSPRFLLSCIAGITLLELTSCRRITENLRELQAEIEAEINAEIQNAAYHQPIEDLLTTIDAILDQPSVPINADIPIIDIEPLNTACEDALKAKQYATLEKQLDELLKKPSYSQDGYLIYSSIMETLSTKGNAPDWIKSSQSIHAKVLSISLEVDRAWEARGSGYASTVTEEGWQTFSRHLANAREKLSAALAEDPSNPAALKFGGSVMLGQSWPKEDWQTYVELTQKSNILDPYIINNLSYYLTSRWHGSTPEITTFFKEELNTWPDGAGKFYAIVERFKNEIKTYQQQSILSKPETQKVFSKLINRYLTTWPEGTDIAWRVADLYQDADLYQESLELCNTHLKRIPESARLYHVKGSALYELGRKQEALESYLKANELDPSTARFNYQIAWFYSRTKNYQQAEPYARKALEQYTRTDGFYKERSLFYIAHATFDRGEYKETIELSQKAIQLKPNKGATWYLYAASHYHLGDKAKAKRAWQTSIKFEPSYKEFIDTYFPGWDK